MVEIKKMLIKKGAKNRPGLENPMLYVTIHNTGNNSKGAGARNHALYLKTEAAENLPVSWHYTADDKEIYQHLPENETAYHAGDGNGDGNRKSIGVEICQNSDGDLLKATDNVAELVADICKRHNIPIENIRQHYDWSRKNCPQMLRAGKPYDWLRFLNKVNNIIEDERKAKEAAAAAEEEAKRKAEEAKKQQEEAIKEAAEKVTTPREVYSVRASWNNVYTQEGSYTVLADAETHADMLNTQPRYFVYNSKGEIVYPLDK